VSVTLLVEPTELDSMELEVVGESYHHLFRAARSAVGDEVRVVDGAGRAREGTVERVDRRRAVVRLGATAPSREPRLRLELLVAPPRPSRASWLVEKATELGVRAIRFLDCERSARPLDEADLERLRRVARAAVEQCGRSRLPEITAHHRLEPPLGGGDPVAAIVLDPDAADAVSDLRREGVDSLVVVVGPEGGLTPGELALARRCGCRPMRLVPALLRIETAAVAAAAWALVEAEPGGPADGSARSSL
jgi:16S rRNA (uracil1498-N3)-methyltransferase